MEIWKSIKNYENDYQISNYGRVKSLKNKSKHKILKEGYTTKGYPQIVLCKNGNIKTYLIHRLVAETFIPNPNKLKEINHKDENKNNNHVNNLEWCTRIYNMKYGKVKEKISKSNSIKVAKINKENKIVEIYNSIKEAAQKNGAKECNIVGCCKHRKHYNTCKGYKWEYL